MKNRIFCEKAYFVIWAIILASLYIFFLSQTKFISTLSLKTSDSFIYNYYLRSKTPKAINQIVIVDIDEATLKKIKQRWPINRNYYAKFLKNIADNKAKPAVIMFNIALSGRSQLPEEDLLLAQQLKESGNAILGTYLDTKGNLVTPEKILSESARGIGFANFPRDPDFSIRRAYLIFPDNGKNIISSVLESFALAKGLDTETITHDKKANLLKLFFSQEPKKYITIPFSSKTNDIKINYSARFTDFKIIPFWEIIDGVESPETFKDKIVILGTAMELLHDIHQTPIGLMPGIAINANLMLSLLTNRVPREIPPLINFIIAISVSIGILFITLHYGNLKGFAFLILILLIFLFIANFLISKDIIFDFFALAFLSCTFYITLITYKEISLVTEKGKLNKLIATDPLTGVYVMRYLEVKLNSEARIAIETKNELSLVIFDIKNFQNFNTAYGYQTGDNILKHVASLIKKNSRPSDIVCRAEGVRFAVILARTNFDGAGKYAEKIKKLVSDAEFIWQDKKIKILLLSGVSSLSNSPSKTSQELIKIASGDLK